MSNDMTSDDIQRIIVGKFIDSGFNVTVSGRRVTVSILRYIKSLPYNHIVGFISCDKFRMSYIIYEDSFKIVFIDYADLDIDWLVKLFYCYR